MPRSSHKIQDQTSGNSPTPAAHRPPAPTVEEDCDSESPELPELRPQQPSPTTRSARRRQRRRESASSQPVGPTQNMSTTPPIQNQGCNGRNRRVSTGTESVTSGASRASTTFSRASKLDQPPKFIKFDEDASRLTLPSQLGETSFKMTPLFVGKPSFGLFDRK